MTALSRPATLSRLREAMSGANAAEAQRCAERLHAALPKRRLDTNVVMVAYGGGKDSSFTLAFVRAIQLIIFERYGNTFTLRSVTNRHAGMPTAVLANIDRAYRALQFRQDPACEALLVDGDEIKPFHPDEPLPAAVLARNRLDLLMTGHRTGAEARPMFCNACNLSMVNAFGLAAAHRTGVDIIITGDSPEEQRAYYLWVNRLARRFGSTPQAPREAGFRGFLRATDDIAQAYFTDIYGPDGVDDARQRRVAHEVPDGLRFFSIFEDTRYSASGHWRLLTEYLGFEFDELAFSFTESDCANPTLMAHLRGLKCERLYGRSYADGLDEYVRFATSLMGRKEFPAHLIAQMRERYTGTGAAARMRSVANALAMEAYGLTEEQLICMVYAPVAGKGEGLQRYLDREQPRLAGRAGELHALLDGRVDAGAEAELADRVQAMSGLEVRRLRALYQSTPAGGGDLMGAILAGDLHKEVIETRHAPDGPVVRELLSGR